MREIRRSAEAQKDVDGIVTYYSRLSLPLANRFIKEYEVSLQALEKMPGTGSLRFAHELAIPGLRVYSMREFPYLVFYRAHQDSIDIDRVLHSHRDTFGILLGLE